MTIPTTEHADQCIPRSAIAAMSAAFLAGRADDCHRWAREVRRLILGGAKLPPMVFRGAVNEFINYATARI